jgi:hypothetical protein
MKAWPRNGSLPRFRAALVVLVLPALACAAQPAATSPPQALAACANISDSAERLACYDKLVGRGAAPAAPASAPAPPQPAGAPASATAGPAAAAAPAASSPQSFGLYSAEHPKPPPVSRTLEARVVALGKSLDGQMTVSLDSGGLWELLNDADPLLAVGDTVTITRAALGSYLMHTPTKRTHRVRRLD